MEVMAKRGKETLAYGPLRPVGLTNPHTNQRPYAVVQLRQDNQSGTLHNLVGFQTNLRFTEQKRVFRLIPGLEKVEFARFGQMHRNTFIHSPSILSKILSLLGDPDKYFAGQITGVEGYLANIASGLFVGKNVARILLGNETIFFPETTMIGSLMKHVSTYEGNNFQPMKANFGLLPPLQEKVTPKKARYMAYAQRAISDLESYMNENNV